MAISDPARKATQQALGSRVLGNEVCDVLDTVEALGGSEVAFLDGVTAGTAAASKAVVLGASKQIATITTATITNTQTATIKDAAGTAARINLDATGLSLFGATPVAQQAVMSANLTSITHTAPGTPGTGNPLRANTSIPLGRVTKLAHALAGPPGTFSLPLNPIAPPGSSPVIP